MTSTTSNPLWSRRERPLRLECRLEFPDYPATRDFLDRAAGLSERIGVHPDISFGRTYVNLTLPADEGATELSESLCEFANQIEALYR